MEKGAQVKGVKYPFEAQEGRWDFSPDAVVDKGLIKPSRAC